jgi:hypothetical protein
VVVISGILWLAIRERNSSLRKLKSISKREDTISDCACLPANRLAFDIVENVFGDGADQGRCRALPGFGTPSHW